MAINWIEFQSWHKTEKGIILWLTGRPGAGKTVYTAKLKETLDKKGILNVVFGEEDTKNMDMLTFKSILKKLAQEGYLIIFDATNPIKEDRDRARRFFGENVLFLEVYLNASEKVCSKRGGASIPFEAPDYPELLIKSGLVTVDRAVEGSISYLKPYIFALYKGNSRMPFDIFKLVEKQ